VLTVTGLVFDLPHAPWMGDVMRLRAAYDPVRLRFPIEITVVGSSGLGWFTPSIAHESLVHKVSAVARRFQPFTFRFRSVTCFPNSNVYYLQPMDDKPFRAFQATLPATGLGFEPTPYGYTPHCTIAEVPRDSASARDDLMRFPLPDHDIQVTSISFYSVDREGQRCYQHERVALGV
jgi:2'-5' RNA ligase